MPTARGLSVWSKKSPDWAENGLEMRLAEMGGVVLT